jgi:hypothetical protein
MPPSSNPDPKRRTPSPAWPSSALAASGGLAALAGATVNPLADLAGYNTAAPAAVARHADALQRHLTSTSPLAPLRAAGAASGILGTPFYRGATAADLIDAVLPYLPGSGRGGTAALAAVTAGRLAANRGGAALATPEHARALRDAVINAAGWASLPGRALEAARPAAPWLVGGGLGLAGLAAAYALWRANVQGRRGGGRTHVGGG